MDWHKKVKADYKDMQEVLFMNADLIQEDKARKRVWPIRVRLDFLGATFLSY